MCGFFAPSPIFLFGWSALSSASPNAAADGRVRGCTGGADTAAAPPRSAGRRWRGPGLRLAQLDLECEPQPRAQGASAAMPQRAVSGSALAVRSCRAEPVGCAAGGTVAPCAAATGGYERCFAATSPKTGDELRLPELEVDRTRGMAVAALERPLALGLRHGRPRWPWCALTPPFSGAYARAAMTKKPTFNL